MVLVWLTPVPLFLFMVWKPLIVTWLNSASCDPSAQVIGDVLSNETIASLSWKTMCSMGCAAWAETLARKPPTEPTTISFFRFIGAPLVGECALCEYAQPSKWIPTQNHSLS